LVVSLTAVEPLCVEIDTEPNPLEDASHRHFGRNEDNMPEVLTSLTNNLYTRLQEAVKEFRKPTFVGRIVLQVRPEDGEGYYAEIECLHGARLEVRPIQRLVKSSGVIWPA